MLPGGAAAPCKVTQLSERGKRREAHETERNKLLMVFLMPGTFFTLLSFEILFGGGQLGVGEEQHNNAPHRSTTVIFCPVNVFW